MNSLIHIVEEENQAWDDLASNRYSVFTRNLMLAEIVSKHQHLTPSASILNEDDEVSFYTAGSKAASATESLRPLNTTPANIGRPRTRADWTWLPEIPERVSSMSTRRAKNDSVRRPDLATFHRQSCQLFASLDSTTSTPATADSNHSRSSTSTSPSLASSFSTQATSILEDQWYTTPAFPSFHLDLNTDIVYDGRLSSDHNTFLGGMSCTPKLGSPRSSSQLSPEITTTEQIFWTSDQSRQTEYAKIDAAHTGVRDFVKRVFPRSWRWLQGKRRGFYTHPCELSVEKNSVSCDSDSIRRFRISTSQCSDTKQDLEHDTKFLHPQMPPPAPPVQCQRETRIDLETGFVSGKQSKSRQAYKTLAKVRSSEALSKLLSKSHNNASSRPTRRSMQL